MSASQKKPPSPHATDENAISKMAAKDNASSTSTYRIGCDTYEKSRAKAEIDAIKPYLGVMDKFKPLDHGEDSLKVDVSC